MARTLTIRPVLNGFVVDVGCGSESVVFSNISDLCTAIGRYYTNPEQVEQEFRDKAINKSTSLNAPAVARNECDNGATRLATPGGGLTIRS
jgi:hypothetical protein